MNVRSDIIINDNLIRQLAAGVASSDAATVGQLSQQLTDALSLSSIATLASQLDSGVQVSSLPVSVPMDEGLLETGNTVRVVDPATMSYYDFVVSADVASGDTAITVTPDTPTVTLPAGSLILLHAEDVALMANSGNGFDDLFELVEGGDWIVIDDIVLETDANAGDGATAGMRMDTDGLRLYDATSTLPVIDIDAVNGTLSMKYVSLTDDGTAATPAVRWDGDPDTGVFRAAADTLAIATGGFERMRVSNSGVNVYVDVVGSGLISADQMSTADTMTVNGQLLVTKQLASAPSIASATDPNTGLNWEDGDNLKVYTGGNIAITVAPLSINMYRKVSLATGELAFLDALGDPTTAGELWRNGANLVWHDGTAATPLATQEWDNASGGRFISVSPVGHTSSWMDGAVVFFVRESTWRYLVEVRASVYTAPTEAWRIGIYKDGTVITYIDFNAGDLEKSITLGPLDMAGGLIDMKTELAPGSTGGAPQGLTLMLNVKT